jgi:succinate dehydrogenase / fumarate reductase flavoprotein subunit
MSVVEPTYKPDFAMPGIAATDPAEQRAEAERWCDRFEANTQKWLKSTYWHAWGMTEHPVITYEDVDTTLIPSTAPPVWPGRWRSY